ncbi:GAL4 enhancer protein [Savitreella phatthalungensis]
MSKIEEIVDDQPTASKIEEVTSDNDADNDNTGAAAGDSDAELEDGSSNALQSKAEQKARKMLLKEGIKKVPAITRVTMRRAKNMLFVIDAPEVYKSPNSDCYIVFGEVKVEDLAAKAQAQAAAMAAQQAATEQEAGEGGAAGGSKDGVSAGDILSEKKEDKKADAEDDDENVDETGVEPKDIQLVMDQAACSRAKAVKALKANDGDIVNAIMEITM